MDFKKILRNIVKTAIEIKFDNDSSQDLQIGVSKFGGFPDLPKDFEWPYFNGVDFYDNEENRPLSFLVQINCEEIKPYDVENLLPHTGMLYFFYELATMPWGFDPKDKGSAKVYYYDIQVQDLTTMSFPINLGSEYQMPQIKLSFGKKNSFPDYEEFSNDYNMKNWDEYEEERVLFGYEANGNTSKLLGYADLIQGDMLLECEHVTNGIYCGSATDIEPDKQKMYEDNRKEWQLLFQLDTVSTDDFELMFGDCGRIYFYIKKEDLKNRNFDNCWLVLQCG